MKVLALPAFSNKELNPYNSLLYKQISKQGHLVEEFSITRLLTKRYDIFHIHWPDSYLNNKNLVKSILNFLAIMFIITVSRLKGEHIFWTVHNIDSHNKRLPVAESMMKAYLIGNLSGSIHLSRFAKDLAMEKYPRLVGIPSFVIPHGHYLDIYPNNVSDLEARRSLGLSSKKKVVTMIGLMRSYKNCQHFIDMFNGQPDYIGVLAGKAGDTETKRQFERSDLQENIKIYDKFIENDDMQLYLNSSDLVIFPYKNILNSGSVIMALGFSKHVLVPRFGSLIEIAEQFPDYVHFYDEQPTTEIVDKVISGGTKDRINMEQLNWDYIARLTTEAYSFTIKK